MVFDRDIQINVSRIMVDHPPFWGIRSPSTCPAARVRGNVSEAVKGTARVV
jgi:hypothetical protein